MSQARLERDLLLGALAIAQTKAPAELKRFLRRMGFRDGDVTFRRTHSGKCWTEINRWPWEPR